MITAEVRPVPDEISAPTRHWLPVAGFRLAALRAACTASVTEREGPRTRGTDSGVALRG